MHSDKDIESLLVSVWGSVLEYEREFGVSPKTKIVSQRFGKSFRKHGLPVIETLKVDRRFNVILHVTGAHTVATALERMIMFELEREPLGVRELGTIIADKHGLRKTSLNLADIMAITGERVKEGKIILKDELHYIPEPESDIETVLGGDDPFVTD